GHRTSLLGGRTSGAARTRPGSAKKRRPQARIVRARAPTWGPCSVLAGVGRDSSAGPRGQSEDGEPNACQKRTEKMSVGRSTGLDDPGVTSYDLPIPVYLSGSNCANPNHRERWISASVTAPAPVAVRADARKVLFHRSLLDETRTRVRSRSRRAVAAQSVNSIGFFTSARSP